MTKTDSKNLSRANKYILNTTNRTLYFFCIAVILLAVSTALTRCGYPATQTEARTWLAYPNSIASAGDSITRGFDVSLSCTFRDCPQDSWTTGTQVSSHYTRLLNLNPAIRGHVFNDAVTGAKIDVLDEQLESAASQSAEYVTVLMGANDLCTPSTASMTPTETFRAQFRTALRNFFKRNPSANMFVASIPNVYHLWALLHTDAAARTAWRVGRICQSMLAEQNTENDRQIVVNREQAFNAVLANVCGSFARCRYDGGAVYGTAFVSRDISPVDYFHPSVQGQHRLAQVTWASSFWG